MCLLLEISNELLHTIFLDVDPSDLAALSQSCQALNTFVKSNKLLYKELYLQRFDRPPQDIPCWETELKKLVKCQKILESKHDSIKRFQLQFVGRTVASLLETASTPSDSPSLNRTFLVEQFCAQQNIDNFLCSSSLFEHAGLGTQVPAETPADQQLSAKLHCLYGVPVDLIGRRVKPTHPYARSRVYDLRNYTDASLWGPFMDDGTENVDWEKVEAIMVVLNYNLRVFSERTNGDFEPFWSLPFEGASPNSFVSPTTLGIPSEPSLPIESQDPYGVTGTWMRVVTFLDYNDLYHFNFAPDDLLNDEPRMPIETEEAIRLIRMKLRVTKIVPPGEDDGQALPVVYFKGTSRSLHSQWDPNANSGIRGTVRLTREGEIRWTTFSIFHGEERWRSEGVQVGGIRSARGVLGNWFDKDYDMHGPAGPTAFWKITDEIPTEKKATGGPLPHVIFI
ncbi:hypothetical protein LTR66_006024 [Elasticomyces elasticus]|nr:hypothetical protein LTR66_006024 [Elasticomyces elasticus]